LVEAHVSVAESPASIVIDDAVSGNAGQRAGHIGAAAAGGEQQRSR